MLTAKKSPELQDAYNSPTRNTIHRHYYPNKKKIILLKYIAHEDGKDDWKLYWTKEQNKRPNNNPGQ